MNQSVGLLNDASSSNEFTLRRLRMVDEQLVRRGIQDERVLNAMRMVPRHRFVPNGWRESAYDDIPLPIGNDQTISQPYTVAFMCECARVQKTDVVLEVGTGSGYGAAILGELAGHVHTVERIAKLADRARRVLNRLNYINVDVHVADGSLGLPEFAPFDVILVTAGAEQLPIPYVKQLAEGGRIVIPIGSRYSGQTMFRFTRHGDKLAMDDLGEFAFVPLIREHSDY